MYFETRKLIQNLIEGKIIPGTSYGFIEGDKQYRYTEGYAAVYPKKEAIQENQLYDVASLTKVMMTTTVILQLLEEGKIAIDDPLQDYLADFTSPEVTVRHLLTHTSAIKGYIPNRDALPAEELKKTILQLPVAETIGKKVTYTDTGMILLGFLIEEVEQMTLINVFEKRVIQPLNLTDSTFQPKQIERCAPTELHPQRGLIRGEVHDPKAFVLGVHCGSAGLFSSLNDGLKFAQMILNKGQLDGVRILQQQTVENLLKDWTPTGDLWRSLGWDLKGTQNQPILFHTGFTGTFMLLDIQREKAFVFLSNRVHPKSDTPIYLNKRDEVVNAYLLEKGKMSVR